MIRKLELIAGICWLLLIYALWALCFGLVPYYWDVMAKITYIAMCVISTPVAIIFFHDFLTKDE